MIMIGMIGTPSKSARFNTVSNSLWRTRHFWKWYPILILLAIWFLTTALSLQKGEKKNDYVVAKVGDEKIYMSQIKRLARRLSPKLQENFEQNREWKENFIRDYVTQYALAKRAVHEKFDENPEVQFDIEHAKQTILSDRIMETRLGQIQVHKEDLDAYYEKNKMKYQDRPFEKIAKQLALDYEQEIKNQILGDFIEETFIQQQVEFINEF